jgi:hypothetical protein
MSQERTKMKRRLTNLVLGLVLGVSLKSVRAAETVPVTVENFIRA